MHPQTRLAHGGGPDPATGAVTPPVHVATTFARNAEGQLRGAHQYARTGNLTREQFEQALAHLEAGAGEGHGLGCAAFASGMAATNALFQSLEDGAHVVLADDVYHGTRALLEDVFARWGLTFTEADLTDPGALRRALRPETHLVWAETPSNPLLKITDLRATAEATHEAGALLVADATWTTPLVQRPLSLGADAVVHSATKYLGGHSDLLGGAVVASAESALFEQVRAVQQKAGAVLGARGAWMALRGMRTLAARLRLQQQNAERVADFLSGHAAVEQVHFPGLPGHPGHATAQEQMDGFGAMCSFEVAADTDSQAFERAKAVAGGCAVFVQATSLGGTESLVEHRAPVEPEGAATPPGLVRLSLGLEHPDDLVADLDQALAT
jgi:cystathionine gamma-synthase